MPQIKVRGRGISAEDTAAVIRAALGEKLEVIPLGDTELEVRRGYFGRARVSIAEEPGGTVFNVRALGPPLPILMLTARAMSNFGIAREVAGALDRHPGFTNA